VLRPTPLQHYIFPAGGDGIHLVVDEHGQFREDNFSTAMAVLQNSGDAAKVVGLGCLLNCLCEMLNCKNLLHIPTFLRNFTKNYFRELTHFNF
jgi:hypothetical protein